MRASDFDYPLPGELIARYPLPDRAASRLLCLDGETGTLEDRAFRDLPRLLAPGDLLVFNDTRVIPARLCGRKPTGGAVEILVERVLDPCRAIAQAHASKPLREGTAVTLGEGITVRIRARGKGLYELLFEGAGVDDALARLGHMPLPPYLGRPDEPADRERYQTVYAREPGAVAAPTAGLHFDEALLATLAHAGVRTCFMTLHIGAGTFKPVRTGDIRDHRMHGERARITAEVCRAVAETRAAGRRVVAVGTTAVRTLETAAGEGVLAPWSGETDLFIYPGFRFRVVDAMITNFHLPRSTLLMLVSAFAGRGHVLAAYAHAVNAGYRFYSYGDAMFLTPQKIALAERNPSREV